MTTIDDFRGSMTDMTPSATLPPALQALWWAGKGNWDQAHRCAQAHEGESDCDLVHAHLHRQEGDTGNASHWYRRAGRTLPGIPLQEEWDQIATELLART